MRFCTQSWDPESQIPKLNGKVALVTGANTGMGYTIAKHLALNGAKVYMGARSEDKARDALQKFESTHADVKSKGSMIWLLLDLKSPTDVMKAVELFLSWEERLDILVNNAARLWSPYVLTKDDLETSVATNHIGHFTLTQALLQLFSHTVSLPNSDVRVITASSDGHTFIPSLVINSKADLNITFATKPTALNSVSAKAKRYGFTKLLNILFAAELQRRAEAQGIDLISISLHPGLVATDNLVNVAPRWLQPLVRPLGMTPLQGAAAALFAATAVEVREGSKEYKGSYLGPGGKKAVPSEVARNGGYAKKLWDVSEETVGEILKR